MNDVSVIRGDLGKLDGKIEKRNESAHLFMADNAGKVATLQADSQTAVKNITEIWAQLNDTKAKQSSLHSAIEAVEAKAKGMAKMWALIGGAAALVVALMEIFGR